MSFWSTVFAPITEPIEFLLGDGGKAATEAANKANVELWREQAEWNKPINQLARLREAGMNPNLIYGSGGVSNTISSAPRVEPAIGKQGYLSDILGLLGMYQQVQNGVMQRDLMSEQINKLKVEENNAMIKGVGMTLDNIGKNVENDYRTYELQHLKDKGTIRGQNMISGVLDRFENMAVKLADSIGTFDPFHKVSAKKAQVVKSLEDKFSGVKKSFKGSAKSVFDYMYDRALSNRRGGRYY